MNSNERAALVDELAEAMMPQAIAGVAGAREEMLAAYRVAASSAVPIIDRLLAARAPVPAVDAEIAEVHRSAYQKGVHNGYVTGLDSARKYIATMGTPLDRYEISHAIGKEIRNYKRDVEADTNPGAVDDERVEAAAKAMWDERHSTTNRSWESADYDQEIYRDMARAALEAAGDATVGLDADRSYASEHHQSLIKAVWRGLESSQDSRFENSGIAHRIADCVEVWLRQRESAALTAAGDAPGLDEMLDSVHPWANLHDVALMQAGDWVADIHWPRDMHNDHGNWHEAQGTGPTRIEAITDAVAKARAQQKEGE